jgi:hypothetical protein
MITIPKNIKVGTKVKLNSSSLELQNNFTKIKSISVHRKNFELEGSCGSFQWGHVKNYTNK